MTVTFILSAVIFEGLLCVEPWDGYKVKGGVGYLQTAVLTDTADKKSQERQVC